MKKNHSSSRASSDGTKGGSCSVWVLILSNVLVFQLSTLYYQSSPAMRATTENAKSLDVPPPPPSSSSSLTSSAKWNPLDPLAIPSGQAINLPSVRVNHTTEANSIDKKRSIYGGAGDKAHLGGFTEIDLDGISPNLWRHMILDYGVHSVLDVGCGRGISTRWFLEHHVDVLCVEGSHDAVEKTFLPPERIVEHDFSRGPWWPAQTYDAVWCIEFLEHVSRQYHFNYLTAFRKAAIIMVSSSRWGGWHHVEVHPDDWWINKFGSYGFKYSPKLTSQAKTWAQQEARNATAIRAPNGKAFRCSHCMKSLKVFVNPTVAALPQHQHLFPRDGCFHRYTTSEEKQQNGDFPSVTRPCHENNLETPLPESFLPLPILPEMHQAWDAVIRKGISKDDKR
mmetsp:Transcript_5781/g.11284  ORF Transcript_5781/g.11284 Transcript_5781/m.11284 type:complete len:394 (-) Transcript_5781:180-1361(-)